MTEADDGRFTRMGCVGDAKAAVKGSSELRCVDAVSLRDVVVVVVVVVVRVRAPGVELPGGRVEAVEETVEVAGLDFMASSEDAGAALAKELEREGRVADASDEREVEVAVEGRLLSTRRFSVVVVEDEVAPGAMEVDTEGRELGRTRSSVAELPDAAGALLELPAAA
jgi:hypothetical protein